MWGGGGGYFAKEILILLLSKITRKLLLDHLDALAWTSKAFCNCPSRLRGIVLHQEVLLAPTNESCQESCSRGAQCVWLLIANYKTLTFTSSFSCPNHLEKTSAQIVLGLNTNSMLCRLCTWLTNFRHDKFLSPA